MEIYTLHALAGDKYLGNTKTLQKLNTGKANNLVRKLAN